MQQEQREQQQQQLEHPNASLVQLKPKPQRKCFLRKKRSKGEDDEYSGPLETVASNANDAKRFRLALFAVEKLATRLGKKMHDPAGRETADERLRTQLVVLLPTLLGEIRAASNILKEAHLRRESSMCAATADVPEDIANEMRVAAAAADSKQFFSCNQTITHATSTLQQLEEDIRRSLDSPTTGPQTLVQEHARRRWCSYLEQALDLLYALNWELHLVRLATNALYVHAQDDAPVELQLQETDGLKDAISRLVATIATKHFGPPTPPLDQ